MDNQIFKYFRTSADQCWSAYQKDTCSFALFQLSTFAILDSLSKIAHNYGDDKNLNHPRVVNLLLNNCDWIEAGDICVLELDRFLSRSGIVSSSKLIEIIRSESQKIHHWAPIQKQTNEVLSVIREEVHALDCKKKSGILKCSYAFMLYSTRNDVVHEYKSVGSGHAHDAYYPYYYQVNNLDKSQSVKLVFPPNFLRKILMAAICNMEKYAEGKSIDFGAVYNYNALSWEKR